MKTVKARAQKVEETATTSAQAIHAEAAGAAQKIEAEAAAKLKSANEQVHTLVDEAANIRGQITQLQKDYAQKREVYDKLAREVAIFDDKLAFAEMGVYEPHFDFSDSDQFKVAMQEARGEQKRLISDGTAVVCKTEWSVNGSKSQGKTMTGRNIRLTLRAFNNECDAAIANTRWNNANAMEKRIINAQEQINKLNASNSIGVTAEFLALKLKELRLTHQFREKLKQDKEEKAKPPGMRAKNNDCCAIWRRPKRTRNIMQAFSPRHDRKLRALLAKNSRLSQTKSRCLSAT